MAIDVYTQHDSDYFIARQTTWGTAVIANMMRLNCEPTEIDFDVRQRLPNRSYSGQRVRPREAFHVDYKGAMPKVTVRGICRRADLKHLLFAVMQDVTAQSGTTPNFLTTMKFPLTQPDFTASPASAWFGTFVKTNPVSGRGKQIKDCILRKLRIFMKEGQGLESRLQYEAEFIGRGAPSLAVTPTGTATNAAESHYDYYDTKVVTIEGVSMVLEEFDITIMNNAFQVGVDLATAGSFLTYGLNPYDVELKTKVAWTTAANDVQIAVGTETDHTVVVSFGTSPNDGFLGFTMETQFGPAQDDDGERKSIDFTGKLLVPTGVSAVNAFQVQHAGLPDFSASV